MSTPAFPLNFSSQLHSQTVTEKVFPMKCPYCKKKGAAVDGTKLLDGASIVSAVTCKHPSCSAYKPALYGPHPAMNAENKERFNRYRKMIDNESDFDYLPPSQNSGK